MHTPLAKTADCESERKTTNSKIQREIFDLTGDDDSSVDSLPPPLHENRSVRDAPSSARQGNLETTVKRGPTDIQGSQSGNSVENSRTGASSQEVPHVSDVNSEGAVAQSVSVNATSSPKVSTQHATTVADSTDSAVGSAANTAESQATVDSHSSQSSSSESYDGDEDDFFDVERIVDRRWESDPSHPNGGQYLYLLKWVGYPDSDNTWQCEEDLDCVVMLQEFKRSIGALL